MRVSHVIKEAIFSSFFIAFVVFSGLMMNPNNVHAQDWALLDELLAQYVEPVQRQGISLTAVDYPGLAQDPRYPQIIAQIENIAPESLPSRSAKLAFYINAYNVYAIKMVIDHYPVESIRDIGSFFSPVWRRTVGRIHGEEVSLDHIEHTILRSMGEPRIHFAIVCASLSCPNLRREAYSAGRLEQQLDTQTRQFLDNSSKGALLAGRRLRVSQIFSWFEEDFELSGGVEAFIRHYRDLPVDIRLRADLPYNWDLNQQ